MTETQYFFQTEANIMIGPISLRGFQNLRMMAIQDKKRKRLEDKYWREKLDQYWKSVSKDRYEKAIQN
jgi:hypothetical protein